VSELYGDFRPGRTPAAVVTVQFALLDLTGARSKVVFERTIGRRVEVLVEGRAEETEHLLAGRHAQQAPEIDGLTYVNEGVAYPGEIVTVEVTDAHAYDLVGRVVARDPSRAVRGLPRAPAPPNRGRGGLPVVR